MNIREKRLLVQDLIIIATSIVVALILVNTDILVRVLTSSGEWKQFGSFIAGLFFTSVFTTALAVVTLGEIAQSYSILGTAFFGAIGAVFGDLIIFRFVKDRFSEDIVHIANHVGLSKRLKILFKLKVFRWMTLLIGGLIIASPFPDELGISILGFSKMNTSLFLAISFVFNFIGIYIIGTVANII